jgi:hypothetical protein
VALPNSHVLAELAPIARALDATTGPIPLSQALDLHHQAVQGLAQGLGISFHLRRAECEERPRYFFIDGYLGRRSDDEVHVRVTADEQTLAYQETRGLVVVLRYLYLPSAAQRQGAATALLQALDPVWRRMGAREIRATATGAGSYVLARQGFEAGSDFGGGPNKFRARLRARAEERPASPALHQQLETLLRAPRLDTAAIAALGEDGHPRWGRTLLENVRWAARRSLA